MVVNVRLFAMLRERAGRGEVEVELPEGATVREAMEAVAGQHGLADLLARVPVVMAVNREYASAESVLTEADELALIPPISGGESAFATGEGYESASLEGSLADEEGNVVATATATARVVKLDRSS